LKKSCSALAIGCSKIIVGNAVWPAITVSMAVVNSLAQDFFLKLVLLSSPIDLEHVKGEDNVAWYLKRDRMMVEKFVDLTLVAPRICICGMYTHSHVSLINLFSIKNVIFK
jgi:hypothetical protein